MNNVEKIHGVLKGMAYYRTRFLEPVKNLYPGTGGEQADRLVPMMYIGDLLSALPMDLTDEITQVGARMIVDQSDGCPTPYLLRQMLGKALLVSRGIDLTSLRARVLQFMSTPPRDAAIAERWLERVIYTLICNLGMPKLQEVSEAEFLTAFVNVLFGEKSLRIYSPSAMASEVRSSKDFRTLLSMSKR